MKPTTIAGATLTGISTLGALIVLSLPGAAAAAPSPVGPLQPGPVATLTVPPKLPPTAQPTFPTAQPTFPTVQPTFPTTAPPTFVPPTTKPPVSPKPPKPDSPTPTDDLVTPSCPTHGACHSPTETPDYRPVDHRLPVTGGTIWPWLIIGPVLVALGLGGVLFARRRAGRAAPASGQSGRVA